MKSVEFIERELPYEVNEEIKQLRTNIKFCGADKQVIMLTSSISGEGKSTLALDIANSFHDLGKKVALVDTDMRKSMLRRQLKDRSVVKKGLSHLLTDQCDVNDTLYKSDTGIYVIFAGPTPPNPSELLSTKKMASLISALRDSFDYVIVDCPPLGAVVDASIVANYCDGAIIVVASGKIPYKVAQGVVKQLENTNCPVLGAILNMVDFKKKGRYYKNYYYKSYYKKYGYYEKEDDRPTLENEQEEITLDTSGE